MTGFAAFNAQDRIFFAYDRALRRLGLPSLCTQAHVHLRGAFDVEGLKRALRALHQVYPASNGRLVCDPLTGRPRWKLGVALRDLDRIVGVHGLDPPTPEEVHRQTEILYARPMDIVNLPPLQFDVLRGLPEGDVVVIRWHHALMDIRGMSLLMEELEKFYLKPPDLARLESAGDERRHDFDELIASVKPVDRATMLAGLFRKPEGPVLRDVYLPAGPIRRPLGSIRYLVRWLPEEQTRQAQETSLRVCGFARFGDFVRATAIRAMHRTMPHRPESGDAYSTVNMIDHRKRRQRGPMCHNLFSGLPMRVPAALAEDRKASAEALREQTQKIVSSNGIVRHLVMVHAVSRLPIAILAESMYRNMCPESRSMLPVAFGTPPSIQVGFSGDSATIAPTFCGSPRIRVYGMGMPPPLSAISFDVNLTNARLQVTTSFFGSRIPAATIDALLDDFVAGLLDPT